MERTVPYVRASLFAGEHFVDRDDAQRAAEVWCRDKAGMRIHGTTQCRPAELFAIEERPHLLPAPTTPYDLPTYPTPKVHRDHHIEVDKALYSVPGNLIGHHVEVRADRALVKVFFRGQLIKVHPRTTAGRPHHRRRRPALGEDRLRPARHRAPQAHGRRPRARRRRLRRGPARHPAALDPHAPGLCPARPGQALGRRPEVDAACAKALEAEAVSVPLIGRMLERATENDAPAEPSPSTATARALRPGRRALRRRPTAAPRRRWR